MPKKIFDWWKWDCVDVSVKFNLDKKVVLYFYWNIYSKKNSKRFYRGIALPSENYVEWNKRIKSKLKDIEWNYNKFPCKIEIYSIAWNKTKWDVDNATTSILDTLVDIGLLPDDNKFIVPEIHTINVWYVKNCPITKVVISPYEWNLYDIDNDHKDKDLKEFNNYLNCITL